MAEAAATAIGIAGTVGVPQNLLQCYKDFLTARDFGDDFAPGDKFLVHQPTEVRAALVQAVLDLISKQLDIANNKLNAYTTEEAATQDDPSSDQIPDAERTGD
ncbi:hypothetical protein PWT90_05656 [Aphanocladium album]|nr:hypothetical protein PWT90_05656 [Aphanocladium album]